MTLNLIVVKFYKSSIVRKSPINPLYKIVPFVAFTATKRIGTLSFLLCMDSQSNMDHYILTYFMRVRGEHGTFHNNLGVYALCEVSRY